MHELKWLSSISIFCGFTFQRVVCFSYVWNQSVACITLVSWIYRLDRNSRTMKHRAFTTWFVFNISCDTDMILFSPFFLPLHKVESYSKLHIHSVTVRCTQVCLVHSLITHLVYFSIKILVPTFSANKIWSCECNSMNTATLTVNEPNILYL